MKFISLQKCPHRSSHRNFNTHTHTYHTTIPPMISRSSIACLVPERFFTRKSLSSAEGCRPFSALSISRRKKKDPPEKSPATYKIVTREPVELPELFAPLPLSRHFSSLARRFFPPGLSAAPLFFFALSSTDFHRCIGYAYTCICMHREGPARFSPRLFTHVRVAGERKDIALASSRAQALGVVRNWRREERR